MAEEPVQASAHAAAMAVAVVPAVAAIHTMMIAAPIMELMVLQVMLVLQLMRWAIFMWFRPLSICLLREVQQAHLVVVAANAVVAV